MNTFIWKGVLKRTIVFMTIYIEKLKIEVPDEWNM